MNITRINPTVFKYNQQITSPKQQKHNSRSVQTQTQPASTPSLGQMHQFVNLSFGKKNKKKQSFLP